VEQRSSADGAGGDEWFAETLECRVGIGVGFPVLFIFSSYLSFHIYWELCVDIDGRQHCDGTVVREISVYLGDGLTLTSAGARRLAALCIEAAAELDRLQ
jgi:hypothetical protein